MLVFLFDFKASFVKKGSTSRYISLFGTTNDSLIVLFKCFSSLASHNKETPETKQKKGIGTQTVGQNKQWALFTC